MIKLLRVTGDCRGVHWNYLKYGPIFLKDKIIIRSQFLNI